MKTIEVKAKSVHEAIEEAVEKLGVSQEDLTIEILEQGGMFKKTCIRATIKDDAPPKKERIFSIAEEPAPAKSDEAPLLSKKTRRGEDCPSKAVTPAARHLKNSAKAKAAEDCPSEASSASGRADKEASSSQPRTSSSNKFTATHSFVTRLLELLENDSTITTQDTDTAFNININGENIGRLIGKNGVVLNAIQTLVSCIAIFNSNGEGKRVFVNIGDYKEKRGNTLESLALKKAEYVKSSGRFCKLEPMNARDRAIIHTALSAIEGIKTYSTGRDPFRCLCIAPADKD